MNEKLKNEITEKLFNQIFESIDLQIGKYIDDNFNFDNHIDYEELRESILLRILKLK